MTLIDLQNLIHEQNKSVGWWDDPRPFSTFVCLFHSELSEAMEGDRKGLMDDHLPQYEMFWVELADFVIRGLDWLGSVGSNEEVCPASYYVEKNNLEALANIHMLVSSAFDSGGDSVSMICIRDAIGVSFYHAQNSDVNLMQIILEKVEYNKHRADHKRENRAKDGGKKY